MFFDGDAVQAIKFHCHGPSCSEGMAADQLCAEAKLLEPKLCCCVFDGGVDVVGGYLVWCVGVLMVVSADGGECVGCVRHDVCHSSRQCSDGAGVESCAIIVDALASCTILLV